MIRKSFVLHNTNKDTHECDVGKRAYPGGMDIEGDAGMRQTQNTQSYLMEYELPITIVMKLSENCQGTAHGVH